MLYMMGKYLEHDFSLYMQEFNFPINPHIRLLVRLVGWLVGQSVGGSVIIS